MDATLAQTECSALAGRYLTFNLGGEVYGLPILKVQEIISLMKVTKIPRTPPFVLGVVNLRGKVIPIVNMRLKFGLDTVQDTERTCIILVQVAYSAQMITIGILVDEVKEVLNLPTDKISKTPPMGLSVNTEFIMGMGRVEDTVVMLLDLDKAFAIEDMLAIENSTSVEL